MSVTSGSEPLANKNQKPVPFHIEVASENSLIIYFGSKDADTSTEISPALCTAIGKAQSLLKQELQDLLLDMVPSYASLLVIYDFWQVDHFHIRGKIERLLNGLIQGDENQARTVTLPVYYDVSVGPDLPKIADHAGISIEEVIQIHLQQEYYVYTIGFAPGFAYLGEVSDTIAMPRQATPRSAVAAGSVAIADKQTAVYPATSPGGWNIIGRCPTPMFTANNEPPIPVSVGDKVRFKAISQKQFIALGGTL